MISNQDSQLQVDLAEIYSCLAEVLLPIDQAGLPVWFTLPGREWPIYYASIRIAQAQDNQELDQSARAIAKVPVSSLANRSKEYETLFIGDGRPPIWLYESHYVDGRIFGPTFCSIRNIYNEAGLEIDGVELADHAGLELSFLAYLVEREIQDFEFRRIWKQARHLFLHNHCKRWLPEVGYQISRSAYPGWNALGMLLTVLFSSSIEPPIGNDLIPILETPDLCTLCGLCTQMCPTKALRIQEDIKKTYLQLEITLCKPCSKCIMICPESLLSLRTNQSIKTKLILCESSRALCPECGRPTFSQAELDYVGRLLENPDWLGYCINCRPQHIK